MFEATVHHSYKNLDSVFADAETVAAAVAAGVVVSTVAVAAVG